MTDFILRCLAALSCVLTLSACGAGQNDILAPLHLATVIQIAPAGLTTGSGRAAGPAVAMVAGPQHPAPDCAAEGCAGPRIIDGNAEAFRVDALRRGAVGDRS